MVDPSSEFDDKFNQNIVNLYPEYDRDNVNDNPPEANSFAKNFPIGDVVTNDLKKSITRETTNNFLSGFDVSNTISSISTNGAGTLATLTFDKEHSFESLKYVSPSSLTGGSNHLPASGQATYHNIKLLNDTLQHPILTGMERLQMLQFKMVLLLLLQLLMVVLDIKMESNFTLIHKTL